MPEIVLIILVVAVLLALVSLTLPLADRLGLPSGVMLAVLGIVLGSLALAFGHIPELGFLGDLLTGLRGFGLSADAFLLLFLPPLLFTAGLTIDVRLMIDEIAAVLLLAVVAVVVATLVVGFALDAVTDIGLIPCMLLAAIVATTDSAAVVSVFRDLGVPRRLTTLVAGESLFNDAAAVAIFALLLGVLISDREISVANAVAAFLIDFIGGLAVGILLARLSCALLRRLRNAPVAEITITVSLAYLTYILGEWYLEVSGVVAVVAAALTFAIHGRPRLRSGTWTPLVLTWTQLEFWANSLIFVLATFLASRVLPEASWSDFGLLSVLILAALAARALVLFGLLPGLSALRLIQPVNAKVKTVILWGGLRGAVTMVLALSISQNPLISDDVQRFVAVLAIGFVLFTLFIGAPTLKPLLGLLGMGSLSPTEEALRDRVMALSKASIREQMTAIGRDYGFDLALARKLAPKDRRDEPDPGLAALDALSAADRLQVGLLTLANRERELYLEHLSDGTIARRMVAARVAAADRLIDRVKTAGGEGYRKSTELEVRLGPDFRVSLWLHRRFGWDGPLANQIADRFETLLATELALREVRRFVRRSVISLLGPVTGGRLQEVLGHRLKLVQDALATIELQYPAFAEALRTQYLALAGLRFEDAEYRRQFGESLISREVFNDLQADLDSRRARLERRPRLDLGLGLSDMVRQAGCFKDLTPARLADIARLLRPRLATPGELLVRKGAKGKAMFFIVSGRATVNLSDREIALGAGDFFGELALLTKQPRNADVQAASYCHLLVLDKRDFRRLLRADKDLQQAIEEVADARLATSRALDEI